MGKIIYDSVRLRCNARRAFELFTVNKLLESWLTNIAEVKPEVGGRYELFWDPDDRENNSTIGCKVTALETQQAPGFRVEGPETVQALHEQLGSFDPCLCALRSL